MRQLGLDIPDGDIGTEAIRHLDGFYQWVDATGRADYVELPECDDPRVLTMAALISRLMPAANYCNPILNSWLMLASQRLWAEHGPCADMVPNLGAAMMTTVALRQDYRTGYNALRHALAVGEAAGYEPQTSVARVLWVLVSRHWFEPLDGGIEQARLAREGLLPLGEAQMVCLTYPASIAVLLDCAPTLDSVAGEVEAGLAFAARTGDDYVGGILLAHRQLLRALRGETEMSGSFTDASFDEATYLPAMVANPTAAGMYHINRALSAALFGDDVGLARHSSAALPLLAVLQGTYSSAMAHLLHALSLARRAQAAAPADQASALLELDACRDWLAARAMDAPANFGHLLRWVEAERAWAVDDPAGAARAFDAAMEEVAGRQRPWHRALITERAAQFHLGHGLNRTGRALLGEATSLYQVWGATAKVAMNQEKYPFLRESDRALQTWSPRGTVTVSGEAMDLMAVLEASRVLSSETSLDRLRASVIAILSTMTGATSVRLLLWDDESPGWLLPSPEGDDVAPISVEAASAQGLLPLSAFRYAERSREPLLTEDATRDDRFSQDPYVAGIDFCSLLIVPIFAQGAPRAMLLLENRLSRGAFSADRLDAVMLIAGQLSVSLDNALVYASLERKVTERTEALNAANERLELLSITDPLTTLANRRRMDEVLEAEWRRAVVTGDWLGAVMIDVDHFKLYNDHYGHPAGDTCLKRIAGVLKEAVRGMDLVARYGGEEFALILPGAPVTAVRRVAERVRLAVVALQEPHEKSLTGIVTVSIGIASTLPTLNATATQLFEAADTALYEAKRGGRNTVAGG